MLYASLARGSVTSPKWPFLALKKPELHCLVLRFNKVKSGKEEMAPSPCKISLKVRRAHVVN